eukprot:Nk52_evm57s2657 gene=Nk52_evmTU57s2657
MTGAKISRSESQERLVTPADGNRTNSYGSTTSENCENEVALTIVGDEMFRESKHNRRCSIPELVMGKPSIESQKQLIAAWFDNMNIDDQHAVINSITNDSSSSKMESRSSFECAMTRLPAIMITMAIELSAGYVIAQFAETLQTITLLTSFMPVISAISGNVGLQSATISVRAIATGRIKFKTSFLTKEFITCCFLAVFAGLGLFIVGSVWSEHWKFGAVVGMSIGVSMIMAGIVGSASPYLFKKFNVDPATSVGPFETAFQDVVGYTIFLYVASILLAGEKFD